jgi:6-pyruvoyltetrahydropterin/6-carboxytetrahydropterin synthase
MIQAISRSGSFEAAHRLLDHTGKCHNIHGHSYKWELTLHLVNADTPKQIIIDYSDLKQIFNGYLDKFMDHALIVNPADTIVLSQMEELNNKVYVMSLNEEYCMTSAENVAKELFLTATQMFVEAEHIEVFSVKLSETPNNHTIVYTDSISADEQETFAVHKHTIIAGYLAELDI